MLYLIGLFLSLFLNASAQESPLSSIYLGSREGDPASLVENVSVIHGDYSEVEVDLKVPAPDSLILSRFYSSRDTIQTAVLGGWRFNPHCFLSIQKDPLITTKGEFEYLSVRIGNPDGSILTYVGRLNPSKRTLLEIDVSGETPANTAKGNINCWTNLKNNKLYFNPQNNSFELMLCSEGKRFYVKHPFRDIYILSHEILPSGNKVFYEYDEKGQLTFIQETNASEKKVLAWIRIQYDRGVHIDASDGKTVDYHFEQDLLTQVDRTDKPTLLYQYQVVDNHALLIRKSLPEGRFVQVDYADKYKVRAITAPISLDETTTTQFSYEEGCTEVDGPGNRKTFYRFNKDFQLTAIEQYLEGSLYRVYKKTWGQKNDAGNLISSSVEDGSGNVLYCKFFIYDDKGNVIEEREYGDLTGTNPGPLTINENGVPNQDGRAKTYSYFSGENTYGFLQQDGMGMGVKYWYKKGTNLLIKKLILTKGSPNSENESSKAGIKKRHFYEYNEDAILIRTVVDDGSESYANSTDGVTQRLITLISPKQELPNIGAPEIIEQKYGKSEHLLKKMVNQFDIQGHIVSQAIYDANENYRYSITKDYQNGLLVLETDALGNKTHYSYDANHNLISENCSNSGISIEYGYDLKNRLIFTSEKDAKGNSFETHVAYDPAGNKLSEIDRYGNETHYINDELGRPIRITYPEISNGSRSSITYTYDLFDNQITMTDPKGRVISKSYTVHGKPTAIQYLDGTQELFKYDSGGNIYLYHGRDGLLQGFKYDEMGRLSTLQYYERGSSDSKQRSKKKSYVYNAFHKTSEFDEKDEETSYSYDQAGRLATTEKGKQKVEFIYDALGRICGVKKWKSSKTFTLEVKDYDLLDRVIEERTEDTDGHVLVRSRYVYNAAGQLAQVIGYPQNRESVLVQYEYDGFGRPCKITNAAHRATEIFYDDAYINEWGQKARKRTVIDPLGNQTDEIFDNEDNIIKVTKKDKAGQLLAESESSYDSDGNKVLERSLVLVEGQSSRAFETEWSYNEKGQLQSVMSGKNSKEAQTSHFTYNSYGAIVAKSTAGSKEPITYQYDKYGNLEVISCKDGKKEVDYRISYDERNNMKEMRVDSSLEIERSFDINDMLVSEMIDDEFGAYEVNLTYDGEGKIKTLKLPDESTIVYTYVGPFVKKAVRFSKQKKELYTYHVASRDQMGNILEEILPGSVGGRKQQWDEAGRRVEIITDFFEDRVLDGGYDPLENINKRQTILNEKKYTTDYQYNALSQLIKEKQHKYSYDSIGNRLQKDGSVYTVNASNQLLEAANASYTYDLNGCLATKTIGDKTWSYQNNALNQLVSIKNPDQTAVKFTYDVNGRRLTKTTEVKGKAKVFRYFYLGSTELGCLDENDVILELKIPSNPNQPESSCFAIEIKKEAYVPIYDLQGNIACLLDQKRNVVETYRYSVYGEEKILNGQGKAVPDSTVGNPWRYRGKRVDKEVGLIYFGYRYYDPAIGRWISPDPAGNIDGPNLYSYARNNPLTYVDYFGLVSTIAEGCGCIYHNHPGWHNAGPNCVCICEIDGDMSGNSYLKIGSDIASALNGISHGVVDFAIGSLHGFQTAAAYMGSEQLEITLQERVQMIEAIEQSQADQMTAVEGWMMDILSVDQSDTLYQSFRSKTTTGLEIGSLVATGYGAVKGVMAFNRLAKMPAQVAKIAKVSTQQLKSGNGFFGKKGFELRNAKYQEVRNNSTIIQNRLYVDHALDQMQNRGFTPSIVEEIIQRNVGMPNKVVGRTQFYDAVNNISVVTEDGQVVTVTYGRID